MESLRYILILMLLLFPLSILGEKDSFHESSSIDICRGDKNYEIYVIKSYWHTGIVIKVDERLLNLISGIEEFKNNDFVDIGWGDEDFYQLQGDFDLYLAAKAVLYPTSSVIRIKGYKIPVSEIIEWSDYCIRFELREDEFQRLCGFIDESFYRENDKLIIKFRRINSNVIFFHSNLKYHLFNTCNTWVAKSFKYCGYDISPSSIITAEDLFNELKDFGTVLKK